MTNTTTRPPFTRSSGNVFEDIQVAEPVEAPARSELTALIARALRARRLTQTAAAKLFGIDQPKVSELIARPADSLLNRTPDGIPHQARPRCRDRRLRATF